jgi:hypothetical protein
MNSLLWNWFSSLGEGGVIAGTPPVGADRVGIGAAFAGVAAWAGAVRQDGTVGASPEFTDLADPADLASTGQVATDLASTDQAGIVLASTDQAATDLASTDQAQIVLATDRAGIVLATDQTGIVPGRQPR